MLDDLRQLIENLPVAVYVCQAPGGLIRFYNRRAVELWGRAPTPGDTDEQFFDSFRLFRPDGSHLPHADTPMARVLRDGGPRDEEVVIERPDGSRVTVRLTIEPLRDAAGRMVGAVNAFQDISEAKRTQDALRLSEGRYRAVVEDQPDLVCRFLADGTISFANEAYCRYFGFNRDDVVGKRYAPVVHPHDVQHVNALVASLSPTNRTLIIENRVVRADGVIRWTQWTNHALYDDQHRLVETQSTGRDITERRQAEEDLKHTVQTMEILYRLADITGRAQGQRHVCEAALEAILAVAGASRASVLVFDASGIMRFMAWRGLSAAYRAAVNGHSPWSPDARDPSPILIGDVLTDPAVSALRDTITGEGIRALAFIPLVYQGRLLGKFMVYYDAPHAFSPDEVRLATTIAHHVAFGLARAQAEAAFEELLGRERAARQEADAARADAERANQVKDEFLAMLAHELRNPLSVIVNAIAVIDASAALSGEPARAGAVVRRQTDHLTRLLDDLLDIARITSGRIELERERIDLREVVELALGAQQHGIDSKRQRLTAILPDRPLAVVGDSVRLQQVLGNLVNNASKYTHAGGAIRVTLAAEDGDAVLHVQDDGVGIPSEKLGSIFDLFSQANPSIARTEGGLGIGLTLVKRVVELHGGVVRAHSDGPTRGAEFVVRLPLDETAGGAQAGPPAPVSVRPRRILVIEDHDDGREMLSTTLGLYGHDVFEAATGEAGIELAMRHGPDVILIDIGLPDLDGYQVGQRLRQKLGASVYLVALTGYGQPKDRALSQQAGFDAHLVKPVDPPTLAAILEELR